MFAIILVSLFVLATLVIGIWGMLKTKTLEDFFLGGRSVGPWVSAFAFGTSYFSAVLFIGFAGNLGWNFGLSALWIALGNAIFGSLLAWFVLGKATRSMSQKLKVMTMPEFFEVRYQALLMKPISALIIFVFLLPYSASVYKGLGYLFNINFGIEFNTALILMTVIAGAYLILGGYFAVTLTDMLQGGVMLIGSFLMIGFLVNKGGGFTQVIDHIHSNFPVHITKTAPWYMLPCLVFMTSFGTWGLPQMIQKFYAIKSKDVINKAAWVTTGFALVVGGAAYFTGAMTHVFFQSLPDKPNAYDLLIPDMLKANLPEYLMAIILLLILSASMSTLSSLVMVSSSAVTIDFYKGIFYRHAHNSHYVMMMRIMSGVFIVISYFIARYQIDFIITLMSISWGAVAGAFLAPYIYGLFWKRTTKAGAYAGMLTGLSLGIGLFFLLGKGMSPVSASIAMIVPFAVVPIVSLLTPKISQKCIERAFGK